MDATVETIDLGVSPARKIGVGIGTEGMFVGCLELHFDVGSAQDMRNACDPKDEHGFVWFVRPSLVEAIERAIKRMRDA